MIHWWCALRQPRIFTMPTVKPDAPGAVEAARLDLFPEEWLRQKAAELGVVERHRKIDPVVLFWTLVFGFGVGTQRQLANLRRTYESNTGTKVAPSSFYDRFTPELVAFLKAAVQRGISQAAEPGRPLSERLQSFSDVVAADGTILRLHEALAGTWAGCRTNHSPAAIKLTAVSSLVGEAPRTVALHAGRKAEVDTLSIGPWVKDRLLLFDLGFYKYQKFDAIERNGGFFISRCKDNANPEIVDTHLVWRGRSVELVGKKLQDVLPQLKREVLDAEVEVSFKRRVYASKRSDATLRVRLVGILNKETGKHHLYLTNIPPDRLKAEDIALMYGARWEIDICHLRCSYCYDLPSYCTRTARRRPLPPLFLMAFRRNSSPASARMTQISRSPYTASFRAATRPVVTQRWRVIAGISSSAASSVIVHSPCSSWTASLDMLAFSLLASPRRDTNVLIMSPVKVSRRLAGFHPSVFNCVATAS